MDRFRPLSQREGSRASDYDALYEDVPSWLRPSLERWISERFPRIRRAGWAEHTNAPLETVERVLRIPLDWSNGSGSALEELLSVCRVLPERMLDLVDMLLANPPDNVTVSADQIYELERMLAEAGSAWTARHNPRGLHRRVEPAAQEAAEQVLDSGTRAAGYLAKAWSHAWGRTSEPSGAFRDAVRAVEAALKPIVSPKDNVTTLGKVIGQIRSAPPAFQIRLAETNRLGCSLRSGGCGR